MNYFEIFGIFSIIHGILKIPTSGNSVNILAKAQNSRFKHTGRRKRQTDKIRKYCTKKKVDKKMHFNKIKQKSWNTKKNIWNILSKIKLTIIINKKQKKNKLKIPIGFFCCLQIIHSRPTTKKT